MWYPTSQELTKCFFSLYVSWTQLYILTFSPVGMSLSIFMKHFVEKDCLIIPTFPRARAAVISRLHKHGHLWLIHVISVSVKLNTPPPSLQVAPAEALLPSLSVLWESTYLLNQQSLPSLFLFKELLSSSTLATWEAEFYLAPLLYLESPVRAQLTHCPLKSMNHKPLVTQPFPFVNIMRKSLHRAMAFIFRKKIHWD